MNTLPVLLRLAILVLAAMTAGHSNAQTSQKTRSSAFEYDPTTGLLIREVIEPGDPASCLATTYAYDPTGNKTDATTRNCNGSPFSNGDLRIDSPKSEAAAPTCPGPTCDAIIQPRTSRTRFDSIVPSQSPGQFPTFSANALGHQELREFEARFGSLFKLTGPNGLVTQYNFDDFGRKQIETRNLGTSSQTTTSWAYERCALLVGNPCPPPFPGTIAVTSAEYRVRVTPSGGSETSTYYDSLNRVIRTETQGFDGLLVRKDTRYDALGRVAQVSQPFVAEGTQVWTTYTYDILGRVKRVDEPPTSSGQIRTESAYSGLVTTVTVSNAGSGAGMPGGAPQTERRTKNSQGQLIEVIRQ